MNSSVYKVLQLVLFSLVLALMFNFLFFGKQLGVSVVIFTALLLLAVYTIGYYQKAGLKTLHWFSLPVLFFSLMVAVRDSGFLTFLNVCAVLGLLLVFAYHNRRTQVALMKFWDYISLIFVTPVSMLKQGILAFSSIGQVHSEFKNRETALRVLKGVVMALPVLIVFGLLFSQADLAFSQFTKNIFSFNISEKTAQYLALLTFAFTACLSYLSYLMFYKEQSKNLDSSAEANSKELTSNKSIETMVFLGLIAVLFFVFIVFQVTYLFGGETNIVNFGFTYAEYARKGFWELLVVAFISLVLLLGAEGYSQAQNKINKQFLIPALILIAEVVIIIVSAFKRLYLYIGAYGMTTLRFYVAAFIALLLVLFTVLAIKFIKAKPEKFFTFASLVSIFVFLFIINIVNPDAFIAKVNIKQYQQTSAIDVDYLINLSADAINQQVLLYNLLQGAEKNIYKDLLLNQKLELQSSDNSWQSYNFSRQNAKQILSDGLK